MTAAATEGPRANVQWRSVRWMVGREVAGEGGDSRLALARVSDVLELI